MDSKSEWYSIIGRISSDVGVMYHNRFIYLTKFSDPQLLNDINYRLAIHREICEYIASNYYDINYVGR